MKAPMRATPSGSRRGATSTSTSALAIGWSLAGSSSAMAISELIPPSEAPTSAGAGGGHGRSPGDVAHVVGERVEAVVAIRGPVAVAVAAQVDRGGVPALVAQQAGGAVPGVPGLPAAGEQQHGWTVAGPVGVGRQFQSMAA